MSRHLQHNMIHAQNNTRHNFLRRMNRTTGPPKLCGNQWKIWGLTPTSSFLFYLKPYMQHNHGLKWARASSSWVMPISITPKILFQFPMEINGELFRCVNDIDVHNLEVWQCHCGVGDRDRDRTLTQRVRAGTAVHCPAAPFSGLSNFLHLQTWLVRGLSSTQLIANDVSASRGLAELLCFGLNLTYHYHIWGHVYFELGWLSWCLLAKLSVQPYLSHDSTWIFQYGHRGRTLHSFATCPLPFPKNFYCMGIICFTVLKFSTKLFFKLCIFRVLMN